MNAPIRITFRENVEHFIEAQGQSPPPLGKRFPRATQNKIMGAVVVFALVVAFGQELMSGRSPGIVAPAVVFTVAIMGFWFWLFKRMGLYKSVAPFEYQWTEKDRARFEKSYRKKTGRSESVVACEFDENGFSMTPQDDKTVKYSWEQISRAIERPKGLFVYVRSWMYFWFPKASFATREDYQLLIQIIAQKVPRFERPDFGKMAFIALGSNLGNSSEILNQALSLLQEFSDSPLLKSSFFETEPVDCPPGSPKFINAVAAITPRLGETPESLLNKLQKIEKEFGRTPKKVLNEARPLDLDLIAFGNEIRATPELILPHPRAHLRRFVLQPLAEIAPDLVLPGQGGAVAMLLSQLTSGEVVRKLP
jgi:2-amino-4-hydroxy-6-hydroxymethyldihydropteridine diphosphokinase